MRSMLLIAAICSAEVLTAAEQMHVAVCNFGSVLASVIAQAKTEAEFVYRSTGVEIVWHDCNAFPIPPGQDLPPWFIIRLRADEPPVKAGPSSLDVMGKAYVGDGGAGSMADAYLPAIRATSEQQGSDDAVLLGCVVAHELGHLLLGPGHSPIGVMQASWGKRQMDALRQRWFHFTKDDGERIRRALHGPLESAWFGRESDNNFTYAMLLPPGNYLTLG